MCDECNTVDTIEHYIFSCKSVKPFWSEIARWWNEISICPVVLTEHHVIFVLYYDLTHFSAINYIILLGKMYIYRQKMKENTIYFNYFLNELKFKLDIQKTICETNNTVQQEMDYYTRLTLIFSYLIHPIKLC